MVSVPIVGLPCAYLNLKCAILRQLVLRSRCPKFIELSGGFASTVGFGAPAYREPRRFQEMSVATVDTTAADLKIAFAYGEKVKELNRSP